MFATRRAWKSLHNATSQHRRSAVAVLIGLIGFCASARSAQEFDKWHPYEDTDPITGKKTFGAYVNVLPDRLPTANGYFEVIATCNSGTFYLRTTYLTATREANPGFINAGRGKILIARMVIDGDVRNARSMPLEFNNIAIFVFAPKIADNPLGDLADTLFAKLPGTPSELVHAKLIKFEIPLADAQSPILHIQPQDPEFQKFASKCESTFPALNRQEGQPSNSTSFLPRGTFLPGRRPNASQPSNPPATTSSTLPAPVTPTPKPDNPPRDAMNKLPANLAQLTIHSGFQPRPGQPSPVARTPFNLMRDDFSTTLLKAGIHVDAGISPPQAFAKICRGARDPACNTRLLRASVAGAAATAISGPAGDATLPPVPPGEYYVLIYGYDLNHRNIFWNQKLVLTPGANSFTLTMENGTPLK